MNGIRNLTEKIYPYTSKIRRLLTDQTDYPKVSRRVAQLLKEDLSSLNRKIRNESTLNLEV